MIRCWGDQEMDVIWHDDVSEKEVAIVIKMFDGFSDDLCVGLIF